MKSAALITSILLLITCIFVPLSSVCAAPDFNPEDELSPGSISPRAVFFHNEAITAELGSTTNANINLAVFPETANIRELTFTSSDTSVVTVDKNGVITARGKGECTVTVTTHNNKTASMTYTVFGTDVENISIVKYAETVYAYDVITLQAKISPENASVQHVSWSSSDENIAKVDENGVVTCGLPGTVMITATAFGGKSDMFLLTVNERPVTEVHIEPEQYEGIKGERIKLNTVVYPENATFKGVTYSSSNPYVASVDKNGTVLLKGKGKAIITAQAKNGVSVGYKVICKKTFESAHFKQGDRRWKFSREVAKKACLITAFAIILKNNGIDATPRCAEVSVCQCKCGK